MPELLQFAFSGLTVGAVTSELSRSQRRAAYACDVTYGTAKEFGFDFLRDRLAEAAQPSASRFALDDDGPTNLAVQRDPFAMLVDELLSCFFRRTSPAAPAASAANAPAAI